MSAPAGSLEVIEQDLETLRDKPMHAFCVSCMDDLGDETRSMCGTRRAGDANPQSMTFMPENICVVCEDLAPRPCERCGA